MDGGNGAFVPDSSFGNLSDASMDLDFMDELLYDGCWLETADEFDFLQAGTSTSDYLNDPKQYFPLFEPESGNRNANPCQENYQVGTEKNLNENPPIGNPKTEELGVIGSQNQKIHPVTASSVVQSGSYPVESSELGRRVWIAPTNNARPSTSVRERLMHAIGQLIKEWTKDRDVFIQIWVPIKKEGKHVLTSFGQPYLLDPKSQSLASYRNVQFPVDEDSKEVVDLPRRVFLRKLPEWTRDVSYFSRAEYPCKNNAKKFDIRGSFAVPVFERGSRTCLGVIEVVTTTQDVSYRPELESVCKALECMLAVDLRSPQDLRPPSLKACEEFCQAAVPEIPEILESVCKAHRLPLALTWAPCFRQGKGGCRHFDENYSNCICTVNSACIVAERDNFGFYMASSEQYLSFDQGIVGRAFATNKQCFSTDVAASSKTDYPLSHHAKMFELHAAIAIPVQSTYAGPADFVLELFLPKDCCNSEEQKRMWDILPITIQQACRSLHVVMDKELEETVNKKMVVASDERLNKDKTQKFASFLFKESTEAESSWSVRVVEAQPKCEGVGVSWDHPKEENIEEFKVTSHWGKTMDGSDHEQAFPEFGQFQQNSGSKDSIETATNASSAGHQSAGVIKSGDKRRTKTEKAISLQVLRQHFAGSLKDAAKSIGVCPTTLKRICRQHGITRWPSRKIKKVGHSLKKLQLVIDSVQGAEGALQIGSFYTTFPELTSPMFSANATGFPSSKTNDDSNKSNRRPENGIASASKTPSPSPSCSKSSGSSICCSAGVKQHTATNNGSVSGDPLLVEDPGGVLKRTHSDAALHAFNHDESKLLIRSRSFQTFGDLPSPATLPPLPKSSSRIVRDRGGFRVKATFGADKIRFTLQPNWGFRDLQQEIARRFSKDDIYRMDLKYLDDDQEWVLLTCDADLEECRDVYKLSESHAIKMSLSQPHLGSSLVSGGPPLVSSLGGATGTLFPRGHSIRN